MKKVNKLLKKKNVRIIMFMILDVLALTLCSFLSINLRFDFNNVPSMYLDNIYKYLVIDSIIMLVVFWLCKLYKSMWSYASITELVNVVIGCTITLVIEASYKLIFNINMPRSYYLIELLLLYIFVIITRYSYRMARTLKAYYKEYDDYWSWRSWKNAYYRNL